MTPKQVTQLTDRINAWYPSARLSPALTLNIWAPELESIAADIAVDALKRYARTHAGYPPSLEDLKTLCEEIEGERRRATNQAILRDRRDTEQGEARDDTLGQREVQALIHSIWPDMYSTPESPFSSADFETRKAQLRQQLQDLSREELL